MLLLTSTCWSNGTFKGTQQRPGHFDIRQQCQHLLRVVMTSERAFGTRKRSSRVSSFYFFSFSFFLSTAINKHKYTVVTQVQEVFWIFHFFPSMQQCTKNEWKCPEIFVLFYLMMLFQVFFTKGKNLRKHRESLLLPDMRFVDNRHKYSYVEAAVKTRCCPLAKLQAAGCCALIHAISFLWY